MLFRLFKPQIIHPMLIQDPHHQTLFTLHDQYSLHKLVQHVITLASTLGMFLRLYLLNAVNSCRDIMADPAAFTKHILESLLQVQEVLFDFYNRTKAEDLEPTSGSDFDYNNFDESSPSCGDDKLDPGAEPDNNECERSQRDSPRE